MNPHANADNDDDDVDTTGGRIIVCAEFLIPSQTKIQGFTKNTKAFKSIFKDASNKTNPKFLCQLVCKLQCIKHDKANVVKTRYFSL